MQVDSFLRLTLVFGNDKAPTFLDNLGKMIVLTLYEAEDASDEKDTPTGLTVVEIIDNLYKRWGLSFSDQEILSAIEKQKRNKIVCIHKDRDFALNEYSITPIEYVRIKEQDKQDVLPRLIRMFLTCHAEIQYQEEEFIELFNKHLYTVFNSNTSILLDLLNSNYDYTNRLDLKEEEFTTEEKMAINKFLYWNNDEKNKCIFDLVSCCFDYCMITAKQNAEEYKDIFKQKVFYLDANIIFRLMGLNHANRKRVIESFIGKCNEQDITVRITNHTKQEIDVAIHHHVNVIESMFQGKAPIDPDLMGYLQSLGGTESFYIAYYSWCKNSVNKHADYRSFEKDLKKQAYDIIEGFTLETFDDYEQTSSSQFDTYVQSLSKTKSDKRRTIYLPSIKTDVNNYMYVSSLNKKDEGANFFSVNNYLISADHAFCDWAKILRPGTVPIVVLPSVWYSIILQYSSRTKQDYESFTSFLNFSMSNNDHTNTPWRLEVLKSIIELNEPTKIKNEVGYRIEERLKTDNSIDLESYSPDELVQEEYQSYVKEQVRLAKEEQMQIGESRLNSYKADMQHEISKITYKAESDVNQAKAEVERLTDQVTENRSKVAEEKKQSYEAGQNETIQSIIETETKKETEKAYKKYWRWTIGMVFVAIGVIVYMFCWLSHQDNLSEGLKQAIDIGKYGIALVAFVGNVLLIGVVFCGLDKERIQKKMKTKVEEKYKYLIK